MGKHSFMRMILDSIRHHSDIRIEDYSFKGLHAETKASISFLVQPHNF